MGSAAILGGVAFGTYMYRRDLDNPLEVGLETGAATFNPFVKIDADAVLEGTVRRIEYSRIRSRRFNTLRPEELDNTVVLGWVLRDAKDPTKVLANGTSRGSSQLFVASNLQTARQAALPEAAERAGEALVSTLANGY